MLQCGMGMDIVEVNLRIEEEFAIDLSNDQWEAMLSQHIQRRDWWIFQFEQGDATVGELCKAVNKTLAEQGSPVPHDTFERVREILAETLGVRRDAIQASTFLLRDLGMD